MSDSDASQPKENILKIMDDFLSHLNRTKKLFMLLIFASFIIAPLSLAFVVFIMTPSFVMQAGQPYDVAVSFVGSPVYDQKITGIAIINGSNFTASDEMFNVSIGEAQIVPHGQQYIITGRGDILHEINNETAILLKSSAIRFGYVPAGQVTVESIALPPPPPPRFMYVNDAGQFGRQTDVTPLIMVIIGISAALATMWLVLGIKEYRFFSKWSGRYSNYKKLQDKLDKELED